MTTLSSRIADRFKDKNIEKKYLRTSALYRLAGALLLIRKQRGLTQKELAEKAGTTQTVISRLESASVKPSLETILKVAEALEAAVEVRLLPIESMRNAEHITDEDTAAQTTAPLKGILYYDWENETLSQDAKWITPENSPIAKASVNKLTNRILLKKSKIREYA